MSAESEAELAFAAGETLGRMVRERNLYRWAFHQTSRNPDSRIVVLRRLQQEGLELDPKDLRVLYGLKGQKAYVLQVFGTGAVVFESDSKSEVIAQAQRRKGFRVDGSESTYAEQLRGTTEGGQS